MSTDELAAFLAEHPPFSALGRYELRAIAEAAAVAELPAGAVIIDAFAAPTGGVVVLLTGHVDLWNRAETVDGPAEERLGPGALFGFSAMLSEQPVGPRAVAVNPVTVARIPEAAVLPAFASPRGARFLASEVTSAIARTAGLPSYSLVDELIVSPPLLVDPSDPIAEVAAAMTTQDVGYAAIATPDGEFGMVTDRLLRERVLLPQLPIDTTPVSSVMAPAISPVQMGSSAAEALIALLDSDAEYLLVRDRTGALRGVVTPRDFAVSSSTAGVSLHEQLRRADTADELTERALRIPTMLGELLDRGLNSDKVIALYAALRDTTVRRAIGLVFAGSPLSVDAFTWLSLGSLGRSEPVLSSDVDSAVAFDDQVGPTEIKAFRSAFAEVNTLLTRAGLTADSHGASAHREPFSRTNAEWRAAGLAWLDAPERNQGAIMTSLLVDGRPIHGDPGLPAVSQVFGELRQHPLTMRLLLQESLAKRAKLRSVRDLLARRPETFDVKSHALLPITNIARWAALSVGSAALPTVERLRTAAGSAMLPSSQAATLIEVFGVLQRLRLVSQLAAHARGEQPTDVLQLERLSPLDRSVIAQAVREIAAVQRRMDNISVYLPAEAWTAPEDT